MNKGELIKIMARDAGLSKVTAHRVIDTVLKRITKNLKRKKSVTILGFGTFKVAKRKARAGRNPQTGKKIKIAAARVPHFSAGAALKKAVNEGE
jgi:nucleoid DNA-binding protein